MEKQFFTNPGLAHIGEKIFQNLEYEDLVMCQNVCHSWKKTLNNPQFWIKSFLIPKIQQDENSRKISNIEISSVTWKKLFEKTYNTRNITDSWEYLHWKKLIMDTVGFSNDISVLKSKVLVEQKNSEIGIQNPHYMALKVQDVDLTQHFFGFSDELNVLKSKVLKVLVGQKRTENSIRNPLYMALKVKDVDLIQHLLLNFLENYYFSQNSTCKMECLKAVMGALKFLPTPAHDAICQIRKTIGKHSVKDGGLRFQYIQLMKTLIKHILQNFASLSYMERHAFVYELEFEDSIYGKSNFKPLIKESYTFNQHQKPTF